MFLGNTSQLNFLTINICFTGLKCRNAIYYLLVLMAMVYWWAPAFTYSGNILIDWSTLKNQFTILYKSESHFLPSSPRHWIAGRPFVS